MPWRKWARCAQTHAVPLTITARRPLRAHTFALFIFLAMKRARGSASGAASSASGAPPPSPPTPPPPPTAAEVAALHTALAAKDEALAAKDEALAAQKEINALLARAAAAEAALAAREAAERDAARDADAARLRRRISQLEDEVTALTPRMDIIGLCVAAGFTEVGERCAGLCRETWTTVPAGLSEADAARVRGGHPIWPRIINARHGEYKETRLSWAAREGKLSRVRELCDWRAGVEEADKDGRTPLFDASERGHDAVVRELLVRGANIEAANCFSFKPLIIASFFGHVDVVRALLAAGADKHHHVLNTNVSAADLAGAADGVEPAAKAAVLALLAAAP
jgi:hypothetical protein